MNLQNRIDRLERAAAPTFDLTRLTDAELLALEACFSKAEAEGCPLDQYFTPEVDAALERVALGHASQS